MITEQVLRLVDLGVPELAGVRSAEFERLCAGLPDAAGAVLVVHPRLVAASRLAPLLRYGDRPGFVVDDMADLDEFAAVVDVPDEPVYLISDVDRGDDMRNWSPDEALPEISARGRTPLTVAEGICWLLAEPQQLERNHCFMTIASRKRRDVGASEATGRDLSYDRRTPAVWISDGAPKVGWCWAGNRHTWLGFASAAERVGRRVSQAQR